MSIFFNSLRIRAYTKTEDDTKILQNIIRRWSEIFKSTITSIVSISVLGILFSNSSKYLNATKLNVKYEACFNKRWHQPILTPNITHYHPKPLKSVACSGKQNWRNWITPQRVQLNLLEPNLLMMIQLVLNLFQIWKVTIKQLVWLTLNIKPQRAKHLLVLQLNSHFKQIVPRILMWIKWHTNHPVSWPLLQKTFWQQQG